MARNIGILHIFEESLISAVRTFLLSSSVVRKEAHQGNSGAPCQGLPESVRVNGMKVPYLQEAAP